MRERSTAAVAGRALTQLATAGVLIATLGALGCESTPLGHGKSGGEAEAAGMLRVAGGEMQSGFAAGLLRAQRSLQAFEISRHPVTWAEFDACVKRGACAPADTSECRQAAYEPYAGFAVPKYDAKGPDAPAVCVGQDQAEAYCKSIGGRLPTLDEWLLAARGSSPRSYAWGDQASACDQHPLAAQLLAKQAAGAVGGEAPSCEQKSFDGSELQVLKHEAGASPTGLQDVLLTPGELLKADRESVFTSCGGAFERCVVYGLEPAKIDSVEPFMQVPSEDGEAAAKAANIAHAYAFRCVVDAQNGVER